MDLSDIRAVATFVAVAVVPAIVLWVSPAAWRPTIVAVYAPLVLVVALAATVWAARRKHWLVVAVCSGIVAMFTFTVLGQINTLLQAMHPLGRAGRGIEDIRGEPSAARAVVDAWQTWYWVPQTSLSARPQPPRVVALWHLGLDTFVLIPAYILSLGLLLRRCWAIVVRPGSRIEPPPGSNPPGWLGIVVHRLRRCWYAIRPRPLLASSTPAAESISSGAGELSATGDTARDRFDTIAGWAFIVFVVVPIADLVENALLFVFIERRLPFCDHGCLTDPSTRDAGPSDGMAALLGLLTRVKWAALILALLLILAPASLVLRDRWASLRTFAPGLRRLSGQFVLIGAFVALMWVNPQTTDLFRGVRGSRWILSVVVAFVAGAVAWSMGRKVTHQRRGRDAAGERLVGGAPTVPRPLMAWGGIGLLAVGITGIVSRGWQPAPFGRSILVGLALVGLGIGVLVRAATRRRIDAQVGGQRRSWPGLHRHGPTAAWVFLVTAGLIVVFSSNWRAIPTGVVIPGGFLLLLAWFDLAGEGLATPSPACVESGEDSLPAFLLAAWPIALCFFVIRSVFPLNLYDQHRSFLSTVEVFAGWTLILPGIAIALRGFLMTRVRWARENQAGTLRKVLAAGADEPLSRRLPLLLTYCLIAIGIGGWFLVVRNPWATGERVGAVALVVAFFTILVALVGLVAWFAERTQPPGLFKVLRMERIPVFTILLAWFLLLGLVPGAVRQDYHDVRTFRSEVTDQGARMRPKNIFHRWLDNQNVAVVTDPHDPRPVIPMVLIASEGGGIKAAVWTSLVLDCILSPDPVGLTEGCEARDASRLPSVIAASGVSGGSVGLVEYARYASAHPFQGSEDWVRSAMGADFVSPSIAWQLYVEAPRTLLQFDPRMDRGEVLERAWEQTWPDGARPSWGDVFRGPPESAGPLADPFRQYWEEHPDVPLLLLNGTSVQDGCKFVSSPIDGNGAQNGLNGAPSHPGGTNPSWNCLTPRDNATVSGDLASGHRGFLAGSRSLADVICPPDNDVRLSTAALLSARFPYVSPSGRLSCGEPEQAVNVVDGGYGENTGAGSILEFWEALRPLVDTYNAKRTNGACIVPALLQIQSGYGPTPDLPSKHQGELGVPPHTVMKAPSGITVWQRNDAQLAVLEPRPYTGLSKKSDVHGVYALVYPYAHPGVEAPLGWTLSGSAEGDLEAQLGAAGNTASLRLLEDFLADPGTCAPVADIRGGSTK